MPDYELETWHHDDDLAAWDSFVTKSPQGSVFCRSWWLRAVCPASFDILVAQERGEIIGGMPLPHNKLGPFKLIQTPPLTQTLGILLSPPDPDYYRELSTQLHVTEALVAGLPPFDSLVLNFAPHFDNWMALYWAGFEQTTRYTYRLTDIKRSDLLDNLDRSKRKNIRRAAKQVTVHTDLPADRFYANHRLTLAKQGLTISYSQDCFQRLYKAAHAHGAGRTWYALDEADNLHAAILVVYDHHAAYYLISTIDPDFRRSGAATLLVMEAAKYVAQFTDVFDFEGSMIPGVEQSFRRFGARQTPYFHITKNNSLPLQIYRDLGHWWRMLRGR